MKKPLIWIIDDDPAVLGALEASLEAAFGEIARVESYSDPIEALSAVESGEEMDRHLAVAVVDQKMPGMFGSELLGRLRTVPRCEHMRAILLTGYGGLESALDAGNTAGVVRYREKPWSAAELLGDVRSLFGGFLKDSGADRHAVLREVRGPAEVEAHLRLRYEVFRVLPHLRWLLPRSDAGFDVDEYDPVSHLMGLFACGVSGERMIGTHRYVGTAQGPAVATLMEVLVSGGEGLLERARTRREAPLPCAGFSSVREAIVRLVERWVAANERFAEASRFALAPDFRAAAGSRRLAFHVIEGAMAFYKVLEVKHVLTAVKAEHGALYRAYGMVDAEGTEVCFCPEHGVDFCTLHGQHSELPARVRSRVETMACRIGATGVACHCPAIRECLAGPYESNRFHDIDLYCPLKACVALQQENGP